jgi:hypothetical protein
MAQLNCQNILTKIKARTRQSRMLEVTRRAWLRITVVQQQALPSAMDIG